MSYQNGVLSKENFIQCVRDIFTNTRHVVKDTRITRPPHNYVMKFTDIEFYERDYKGDVKPHYIKNSRDNRRPSVKPNSKKLPKKIEYVIRIICNISSFNFFPVGVCPDSQCLEGEDRGHAATILWCHFTTFFDVKVWRKVHAIMSKYMSNKSIINPYIQEVYARMETMIQNHKGSGFSLQELIPQNIMEDWTNNATIPVQIKTYPNRDMHVQEIIKFNGTEDTWIAHQRALRKTASYLRKMNVDAEHLFDTIFSYVDGNDYFIGNDEVFFTSHRSQTERAENSEEEIVWLWLSATKTGENDLDIYRKFNTTDEDKRYEQYEKLLEVGKYRGVKSWQSEVEFLNIIALSKAYTTFENTLENLCKPLRINKKTHTNLKDLTVGKVDAALMFCWIIRKYIDTHKLPNTVLNYEKVANLVFEKANELLKDDVIVHDLLEAHGSHKGRYDNFFKLLIAHLEPTEDTVTDIKQSLLLDARTRLKKTSLNPDVPFMVIDRSGKGAKSFKTVEIDLVNGTGLDKGHKDPSASGNNINNFFLQFAMDNRSWSNNRIFDPAEYGAEYLAEVYKWVTANNNPEYLEAYMNTKKFIDTVWN